MVDDGSYSHFSWEKVAFEKLMTSISRSMNEVQKFYRLSGQPYALQIWCYECCAKVDESLVVRVHNLIPRMVNCQVLVYRNITPSQQELNHLDLPNTLMFGSADDDANPRVSLDKGKVVPNIEIRDVDKSPVASEKKLSLYKSDLDEIKSYVRTYVVQYLVHESEKGNPDIKEDPPQSLNTHTTDTKSYNVVDATGQSSNQVVMKEQLRNPLRSSITVYKIKFEINQTGSESSYADKLQEDDRHSTDAKVDESIKKERVTESKEALHNTDEDFSKAINLKLPSKRNRQPSRVYQSPFVSEFDSGSKYKEVIQSQKKLKYPFEGLNINGPYAEDLFSKFSVWMSAGLYNPHANKKKAKLDTTSEYRYTTVNFVFMNYIHDTYTHYHRSHSEIDLSLHVKNICSMKVASVETSICEIIQGLCIPAGISWHLIDEVHVTINYKGSFHWVLAVIVLKERCIRVYDSMKDHIDWSLLDAYKEKSNQHAFDVHIVEGIVQQSSGMLNCGLFVAAYAEYLSDRHQIPSLEFDPKKHCTRYTSLLWDYGVNKACTGYVSDNQDLPRPKHTFIQSEDTEMIDVEL
ncbi:hypothetical protein CQW23_06193 [Capsicum baccatum]|uniref:Ubiquitin-like protease family profile domain-containing protein n=1 Tax=Capsicum baccatum TaxID=33114 RepID=A0A2G2X2R1_CAPBA|nr:hypothetical protein CQW23_06193 [Capsicum baccatum]